MKAWPELPFDDLVADLSAGNVKTPQGQYQLSGRFAIVDQGKALIAGYVDEVDRLCKAELPAIVFGDHTRCFKFIDFPFCVGADGVKVLRPRNPDLDPKYLYHFLRHLQLPDGGYDRHFKYLKRETIPLPPLVQQRRIAAILDQAEALRAQRRAAIAQLDSLGQAIFVEMFGSPRTNPKCFVVKALPEVCALYSGGTPSKAVAENWTGTLPWFSAKDMKQSDLFDSVDHIDAKIPDRTSLRKLPADTVAIVVRGMILAHTFPVCVLRTPSTINQDLKALIPKQDIAAQFLAHCLRAQADHALQLVSEAGHGTKRLDAKGLAQIGVLLPPVELQRKFSERVREVEAMKKRHLAALTQQDALFASLQHRAFRGELTSN